MGAGQWQHVVELLRDPAGPAGVHGEPQPVQARPVHPGDADPGACAGADRRRPARLRAGAAVAACVTSWSSSCPMCASGAVSWCSRSPSSRSYRPGAEGHLNAPCWLNSGYLVLRQKVFDNLPENSDLVADACAVLAEDGGLAA
jgi:hypothetical protein